MKAGFILSIMIGLITAGCSPVQNKRRVAYCLAAEFNQNGKEKRSQICNIVEMSDTPESYKDFGVSTTGCRANASSISIPVRQGDIVMLTDGQPGEPLGQSACAFGRLKEANKTALDEGMMPRFIFVPTGGSLNDATEIGYKKLSGYGIDNFKVLIEENVNQPFTHDEMFLKQFGCTFSSLEGQYTSDLLSCNSLAVSQIAVP